MQKLFKKEDFVKTIFLLISIGFKQLQILLNRKKYPENFDNDVDDIIIPLGEDVILDLFGSKIQKTDTTYSSYETIHGYRNALMYIYHERRVKMDLKTRKAIDDFMKGYRRRVADLKESDEMSMFGGKIALCMQGYGLLCKISIMTKRTKQNVRN
jgi:hypothetical protein